MTILSGRQHGFSLIELLVTMGIFSILIGIVGINLLGAKHKASLSTNVETLVTNMKQQQIKAMTGDTTGGSAHDNYGIHFDNGEYYLFHGSYVVGAAPNIQIKSEGIAFTTPLPNSEIVFKYPSGEILNFDPSKNTITVQNTESGGQKTITINTYGVITGVN